MNNTIEKTEPAFDVIGIAITTYNKENMQGDAPPIAKLWQRFFSEDILSRIPNKINDTIFAVYYDYESDRNGEYTLLLGAHVSTTKDVPQGMVAKRIPEEPRMIFTTDVGPSGTVVFNTWQKIWNLEDQEKINRSYLVDYELYDERSHDRTKAQAEIHIGIEK